VNTRASSDFTPLHESAASGRLEFATLLLEHGADVNAKTAEGKTPLDYAREHDRTEMVELLRKHVGDE
jgi:ankyrin repeat protein